jgi:hypothetical protein
MQALPRNQQNLERWKATKRSGEWQSIATVQQAGKIQFCATSGQMEAAVSGGS